MGLLLLLLMSHREHYGSFALRGLQTQERRLKPADIYRSKPEIAAGMIRVKAMGFRFKLVLADGLYGCGFINVLYELKLDFVVAIRSNAVWLPREQTVHNRWRKFACSAMVKRASLYSRKYFGKRRTQQ